MFAELRRRIGSAEMRGMAFILPWAVGFLLFLVWPLLTSLYYAFCDFDIVSPPDWVGLRNFQDLLDDGTFRLAFANTLYFMVVSTVLTIVLSTLIAVGIEAMSERANRFLCALVFFPSLVPAVAVGMIFLLIFNSKYGVLNVMLGLTGMTGPDWLGDPAHTKSAVILGSLWGLGGAVVINAAALREIPRSLYEAAELDGAGPIRRFFSITVPMLSPVLFFHLSMGVILSVQLFGLPYILFGTFGGPGRSSLFAIPYIYETAFSFQEFGYTCAMSWVLFAVIILINFTLFRFLKPFVTYDRG